jgi:hypothetical protein
MADTKITALTALTSADPANDVIPIVDVSDTSMAASGTTKKISVNNILGASGVATLASATITGALTVDTTTLVANAAGYTDKVGIGTATPAYTLDVIGTASIGGTGSAFTRFTSNGGLTASGVGAYVSVQGSGNPTTGSGIELNGGATPFVLAYNRDGSAYLPLTIDGSSVLFKTSGSTKATIDSSGNVGVGVTPSAWASGYTAIQNRQTCWFATSARDANFGANVYVDAVGYKYIAAAQASLYTSYQGAHTWYTATAGAAANDPITPFASAKMTLDVSGRLLVGSTSAFTDLTGSKEVKIGDGGIQTFSSAITAATATNIARSGFGALVHVAASNGTGQYSAVVIFTSASATVVSVINGTGSTITFGVASGFLQITSSLALTNLVASGLRNN